LFLIRDKRCPLYSGALYRARVNLLQEYARSERQGWQELEGKIKGNCLGRKKAVLRRAKALQDKK